MWLHAVKFNVYFSLTLRKVRVGLIDFLDNTISSRPELAASSYTLVASYPEKELKDDAQTLAAAELFNAFITQKTEKLAWK